MKQKQINETSWKEVELGDKNYFEIIGSGIKKFEGIKDFLSTKCIKYDKIKKIECQISFNERPSRANMQPQRDSIWFAKMQGTIKTYLFSDKNPEEIKKYILSTGFSGIRTNNLIYPKYLQFYFLTKEFNKNKDVECIGGTQKAINNSKIAKLKISLPFTLEGKPDITKQKQIATILENAKKLKDKNKIIIEDLDEYLKSVFYEMFLKEKGKFEEIELKKLCDIRRGASPRPIKEYIGKDVPWIKIGDGTKGDDLFITKTKEKIKKEGVDKSVLLKEGTLIFANCGVSLGFSRILKISGCIHDGWLAFENLSKKINPLYLLKFINSKTNYFRQSAPDGTQPNLNIGIMSEVKIPLPPITLQEKFASIVKQVEKTKEKLKQNEKALEELFNSLMQKVFLGELI